MKINDTIRTRRQALGLTQEVLADRLGVSAPAVNKWEKALNYPDITLLPVLARTLGIDLNTLLSFQEDMSREEIGAFLHELSETARVQGCAAAFQLARSKLWEFPNNDLLAYNTALLLNGALTLYPENDDEQRKAWEQEVVALHERSVHGADPKIREHAAYTMALQCIGAGELEQAEALCGQLSDMHKEKQILTALLRKKQGRCEDAWILLEKELFAYANEIENILLHMLDLALAGDDLAHARVLAELASAAGRVLGLSVYGTLSAPLQLALAEKDGPRALSLLEKWAESLATLWDDLNSSPLYRHLPVKKDTDSTLLLRTLFGRLEADPESRFLKDVPGYQKLAAKWGTARPAEAFAVK